ncbi:MAG: hypothetical protein ACP5VN_07795 [Acidobacteriota bacterium]
MTVKALKNRRRPEGAWSPFEERLRREIRRRRSIRLLSRAALLLLAAGFAAALRTGSPPASVLLRADVPSAAAPLFTPQGATALCPSDSVVLLLEVPG